MGDAALFLLGAVVAVLGSAAAAVMAAWVTLRIERQPRGDEREDRAQEAQRRWDEQRHLAYADYLAAFNIARAVVLEVLLGFTPDRIEVATLDLEQCRARAELLMSDTARGVSSRACEMLADSAPGALSLALAREGKPSPAQLSEREWETRARFISLQTQNAADALRLVMREDLGIENPLPRWPLRSAA